MRNANGRVGTQVSSFICCDKSIPAYMQNNK